MPDTSETKLIAFGGAVKAIDGPHGRVGGYLVMWGDAAQRDLTGEYFTPDTDLGLDWFDRRPALYHHGLDQTIGPVKIGQIDLLRPDDTGVWVEAQLDLRHRYAEAVLELVDKAALGWSSGTLPHLYRVERGKITYWPIIEGSLTPTPAEPRITVVPLKALLDLPRLKGLATTAAVQIGDATGDATPGPAPDSAPVESGSGTAAPPSVEPPPAVDPDGSDSPETVEDADHPEAAKQPSGSPSLDSASRDDATLDDDPGVADDPTGDTPPDEGTDMDPKQLATDVISATLQALGLTLNEQEQQALVDAVLAQLQGAAETPAGTMAAGGVVDPAKAGEVGQAVAKAAFAVVQQFVTQRDATKAALAQVTALKGAIQPDSPLPTGLQPGSSPRIEVRTKYHELGAEDMAFLFSMRHARKAWQPGQPFWRELADKASKGIKDGRFQFLEVDQSDPAKTPHAIKAITGITKLDGVKSDEVMGTGQGGYGADWVPDLWSSELWGKLRTENRVISLLQVIDMPQDDYILPIDGADPIVYRVPQTADDAQFTPATSPVTASKPATDKVTLSAKKLGVRVPFSEEENEDSIIPFIPELRARMLRAMEDAAEYAVLHADTTTGTPASANINLYDDVVASTDLDRWLLGFNGIAHLPLVDAATLTVDNQGAVPDVTLLRGMRKKLAVAYMADLDRLVYVVEPVTGTALLDMDGVQTLDKFGPKATLLTGQLAAIDNIPIVPSAQFLQADDNGMLSATAGNNIWGRVLLFHRHGFRVGYRRRVSVEDVRFPLSDAHQMVAFMRIALVRRDATCASIGINIAL